MKKRSFLVLALMCICLVGSLSGCHSKPMKAIDATDTDAIRKADADDKRYLVVNAGYLNLEGIEVNIDDLYRKTLLIEFGDDSLYRTKYDSICNIISSSSNSDGTDDTQSVDSDTISSKDEFGLNGSYIKLSSGSIYSTTFARKLKCNEFSYKNSVYTIIFMKSWGDSPTIAESEEFTAIE